MSYEKFYPNGWQSGETGGTPITPEALNHIEDGIRQTYSDFAPAGYGFGGSAVEISNILINNDADLEAALEAIYSKMKGAETKLIRFAGYPSNSDYNWFGFLFKASANYGTFVAYSAFARGTSISKTKYNDTWEPLEWVNPLMVPGVEYRTTKRHNGKVVYTKLVEFMALPNNAEKSVNAMPAYSSLVSAVGYASGANYNVPIPGYYGIKSIGSTRSSGALWLSTSIDMSSYNGWITIEYTK